MDLTENGNQPMKSQSGRWIIVYNGEIYNTGTLRGRAGAVNWQGHSDTEVLLESIAARGVRTTLENANGMFAFAVWDHLRSELWLARDRFGEKPIYYSRHRGALIFASELGALRELPDFSPSIDRDALTAYFRWTNIPAPQTIYEGVRKLPPGHLLRVRTPTSHLESQSYWSLIDEAALAQSLPSGNEALDEFEDLFERAVADRMVADVALGAFLSGGIDSSAVLAMMQRSSNVQTRTFTVSFPGTVFDESELKQLPKVNGGIVVMDPFTGRVYALSGGFSFKKSEFNRASQALRQPGSAFKPFIYALALENNFSPNTLILDAPLVLEQGSDLKMWKPENYGKKFYGPSTLRMGLEKSRNLMTVRVAQEIGVDKIADFTKQLGIYDDPQELLSISLGSAETTLLKLTSAYCSFVNGGKKINPILIDRIQDSEGVTFFNTETRSCKDCDHISYFSESIPKISDNFYQVISPQSAYQVTSMLEGVIKRGTGKRLRDLKLDIAGKTGTTNKNTDTWFVGFTSKLVIGTYVGMDEPKSLGRHETGATTAMPIFKDFVKRAIKKKDARPFKVAPGISMMVIESTTGKKANFGSKETIIEAFKKEKIDNDSISFGNINDRLNNDNILKFY